MPAKLDAIVTELAGVDREERIAILVDRARGLKLWPERLEGCRDLAHRVQECQSPVYLVAEPSGDHIALFADAPIEAPTVRGFVALLVEGLDGATAAAIEETPDDLIERAKMPEILGPRRLHGLHGIVRRLRAEARRAATLRSKNPIETPSRRGVE